MGEARNRGTYEERVQRAEANARCEQRQRECAARMRERFRRDEALAYERAQRAKRIEIVGVVPSPRHRPLSHGLSSRGMLVAALALSAAFVAPPAGAHDPVEELRRKMRPHRGY